MLIQDNNAYYTRIQLYGNPELFRKVTNFTLPNFIQFILIPMTPWVEMTRLSLRNYDNNTNPITKSRVGRGAGLGTPERILRWLFIKKRLSFSFIELLFDQSKSVISKDYYHCSIACVKALADQFLAPPDPTSQKFTDSIGIGAFKNFDNVSRAGDVTKVCNFNFI